MLRRALAMLVLAACSYPALPELDAMVMSDRVAITVTNRNEPVVGAPVYFQNADSSLVATEHTDANGGASAKMDEGGYVTFIQYGPTTYLGVKPGDDIHLDLDPQFAADRITVNVTVPIDPNTGGNYSRYDLLTTCGYQEVSPNVSTPVQLVNCNGKADMLVVTSAPDGVTPLHEIYRPGVAVADGKNIVVNGSYSATGQVNVTISGNTQGPLEVDRQLRTARGPIARAGVFATNETQSVILYEVLVPGSTAITSVAPPTGMTTSSLSTQELLQWAPQSSTATIDMAAAMLPGYTSAPIFDPAANAVTWTEAGGGTPSDVVFISMEIRRGMNQSWYWSLLAPRGPAPTLPLPTLPADALDLEPIASDCVVVRQTSSLAVPGGYDAVRAKALPMQSNTQGSWPWRFVSGSEGHAAVENLFAAYTPPDCQSPPFPP